MLYRKGTADDPEMHGLNCETMLAEDAEQARAAMSKGWTQSPYEAHGKTPVRALVVEPTGEEMDRVQGDLDAALALNDELSQKVDEQAAEITELKVNMAKFDRDGDGRIGGSKAKAR